MYRRYERWARVTTWTNPTSAEEVARRVAGRRRYNAARQREAETRRLEVVRRWIALGGRRGSQTQLAEAFGVHRVTIARDLRAFWDRGPRTAASRRTAEAPSRRRRHRPAAPPVPPRTRRARMSDRVSFRVEDGLLDHAQALADQRGQTLSEVLRQALDSFCGQQTEAFHSQDLHGCIRAVLDSLPAETLIEGDARPEQGEVTLYERVSAVAQAHGEEAAALIRRAVTVYLDRRAMPPVPALPAPARAGPAPRVVPIWPPRAEADEEG